MMRAMPAKRRVNLPVLGARSDDDELQYLERYRLP